MQDNIFGTTTFNMGWETTRVIPLFGQEHKIVVSAVAYQEAESTTVQQKESYYRYLQSEQDILRNIECQLADYAGDMDEARLKYHPSMLQFQKDGSYAMLFDDNDDVEGGVAVCVEPRCEVLSIDEYL